MKTTFKYKTLIFFLVAVLILGVGVYFMVKIFTPESKDPHEGQVYINDGFGMVWITPLEGVPVNTLSQGDFRIVNGQPHYKGDGYEVQRGIDVSEHQLGIDWGLAAADIDFAYIRLGYRGYTEGGLFEDAYFNTNIQGALDNGLDVGVYFFSQAITPEEAAEEARFCIERLEKYDIKLPVVYDWEKIEQEARTNGMKPEVLSECAIAFCETVKAAGYVPAVYFNRYMGYYMFDLSKLTDYDFWLAVPGDYPDFYYASDMWQYSFTSTIPGISEPTDMNLRFVPLPGAVPEDGGETEASASQEQINTDELPTIGARQN